MKRLDSSITDYYNQEVVKSISEKYGYSYLDSLRLFVNSETHRLLENEDMGMTDFGANAIFEIWEAEKITGNPRNSVYVRL